MKMWFLKADQRHEFDIQSFKPCSCPKLTQTTLKPGFAMTHSSSVAVSRFAFLNLPDALVPLHGDFPGGETHQNGLASISKRRPRMAAFTALVGPEVNPISLPTPKMVRGRRPTSAQISFNKFIKNQELHVLSESSWISSFGFVSAEM